jgi:aryl-alcohol dehydrogenase-like predicted oxidoreductase
MNYQLLGPSDLKVSEISFGCMSLGRNHDYNSRLIHQAIDHGINFFDTADRYQHGFNEKTLGRALKDYRDDVLIATKVGHQWNEGRSEWEWKPTKQHILKAVDLSLKRLQTDRIDLYQLHGGTIDDPIDEIIEAFERLRDQGKIRYYGISSIRPNVIREYADRSNIVSVMMQYSLLDRRPEESCLDLLHESGIGVITRGSLAKGLLVDKEPSDYLGHSQEDVKTLQRALNETGKPIAANLQYVLRHPAVSTIATGIRTLEQLEGIIQGYHNSKPDKLILDSEFLPEKNVYQAHR